VIPPGVDSLRFRPDLDADAVLKKHHLFGRQVILTVSHLVRRKGHANVIRALPNVLRKVPNAVYLIVGRGAEEVHLRKLVHDLGLQDKVIFVTRVTDEQLPLYYNVCQVFIMPSYEIKEEGDVEGFGIVFLEANACGKPVIGGRSGGVEDAIINGETGLLVNPLNVVEIANALTRILTDREFAERLGRQGGKRAERELSWKQVTKRILEVMAM
ncbi:glycosyltransferase, partial [bacterium]|nr:glycosyltransferase [bacterium]